MTTPTPATVAVPVEDSASSLSHRSLVERLAYAEGRLSVAVGIGSPRHIERCAARVAALRVKVEVTA